MSYYSANGGMVERNLGIAIGLMVVRQIILIIPVLRLS